MQANPYMKLNRIEFMATYQCTGRCKHCSVAPLLNQPNGDKHVRAEPAAQAIHALCQQHEISSVMAFGGEPLLYPEAVCALYKSAAACGIPARQIITNGYFTKQDARRRQVAFDLARSGVTQVLLSVDAFHQETIPVKAVHAFARDCIEAGIPDLKLQPAWVVNAQHDNPYNERTRKALSQFSDLGIPINEGNNIFLMGNARIHLAQFYEATALDLTAPCGSMPYSAPLTEVSALSIIPNGDVTVCGGFTIGNIYEQDILGIVSRYDPYANDAMRAVLTGGVPALCDYAEARGIHIDPSEHLNACEVCRAIAREL
ncbi:MAG: radical SAM protein [Oscillospiraceae bacterium]|jgi:MoaA/NifB/PqqE/SkfB family radical SAM enzyme|nr:radical SAM protein [Oscillospiraceae bacterium]